MDFKIFRNKTLSTSKDKMLLAQPTMLFRTLDPNEYAMVAKHIVTEDDIVRPDLISVKHYGGTDGLDIILKFNGISDPFSIMPDEVIYVPIDSIPYYKLESPSIHEDNPIKNQFLKTKRLSKTDQRRVAALKKKYNKETLLPPNVIPVGRKNYEFDGTNVRLGMGPQTDPVVNSIISDINKINDDNIESDNIKDDSTNNNTLVIDVNDNSQNENNNTVSSNTGVSGNNDTISDVNSYEDTLNENSGTNGNDGVDGNSGDREDNADGLGGNIPDTSSPSSDNDIADNPDSPCSK